MLLGTKVFEPGETLSAGAPPRTSESTGKAVHYDWVGRRCVGVAHPAATQRGPTESAGKPAHSTRFAIDQALALRSAAQKRGLSGNHQDTKTQSFFLVPWCLGGSPVVDG